MRDLREHIEKLEKKGKLIRIKRLVNKDTELMPIVRWQFRGLPEEDRKAFLFENVTDVKGRRYNIPVIVASLAASREVYAIGMGCNSPDEIQEKWTKAQFNPIPPKIVRTGPVHEVVIKGKELNKKGYGIDKIPIPISTPGFDNGPYTTASHWVTKDPDTGIRNIGNYRSQIKSQTRIGVYVHPVQHIGVHWNKYRKKGKPMDGALVLGSAPAISYTAVAKLPYGVDEFTVAGGLLGRPIELVKCKTVDLEVPASAEIVIEGKINTKYLEPEAPFGEYTGYMGQRIMNPFCEITCITHRKNPIYAALMSQCPPSESSKIRQLAYDHVMYKFLKYDCNIPSILDVAFHESSGSWEYCVIKMKKTNPSQPWQALNAAISLDPTIGKIVIAVDEDINPRDADSVNWALSFRMQPHLDTRITMGKAAMLDYSAVPPGEMSMTSSTFLKPNGTSALLIDATRKWDYPPVSLPKKEFMERARKIWEEEGLPKLKPMTPWYGYNLGFWSDRDEEESMLALKGEHYKTGMKIVKERIKV